MLVLLTVRAQDETPLTYSIRLSSTAAVDILLRSGADPNIPNSKGITPISAAAHKGCCDIMRLLIRGGADVNRVNPSGSTALIQVLLRHGNFTTFRLLMYVPFLALIAPH